MQTMAGGRALLAVTLITTACSSSPSAPAGMGRVQFQISSTSPGIASGAPALAAVTVSKGTDVLEISSVQLVARKIKLERENGACPAPVLSEGNEDAEGHDADEVDSPECPNLRLGPLLLDPPVADAASTAFTVDLPIGTYDELKLQIHRPTDHAKDAAFLLAHPDFAGVSIRVNGTFNGTPFTFTTDLTAEVETEFETPIEVVAAGTTSITLQMDVRGWFLAQGGAALVSPLNPTLADRQRIEQNIRISFHAFEDEDHDGHDD